jgi:xyloglucan-specific exo-beta-1,4-glucanase
MKRLAVDPHSNNIIYFGARSGHGLWKSTDYGVTWNVCTISCFSPVTFSGGDI